MTVETDDVGDESQVVKRRQNKKSVRDEELDDLKAILNTYGGRAFYWRLLSQCNMFKPSYISGDTHGTAVNEGKRMIGLWSMGELAASLSSAYDKMRIEAEERERK